VDKSVILEFSFVVPTTQPEGQPAAIKAGFCFAGMIVQGLPQD
jgi:hypothetical protein